MKRQKKTPSPLDSVNVYIAHLGSKAGKESVRLAAELRKNDIACSIGESTRSLKAQLRRANTSGAKITIIIGEEEIKKGTAVIKSMQTDQSQIETPISETITEVVKILKQ